MPTSATGSFGSTLGGNGLAVSSCGSGLAAEGGVGVGLPAPGALVTGCTGREAAALDAVLVA